MARIWMIHPSDKDVTRAKEHSKLPDDQIFMHMYPDNKLDIFHPDLLMDDIKERTTRFMPDHMLLIAGNILANAMAIHVLLKRYDALDILVYNAKTGRYVRRTVSNVQ